MNLALLAAVFGVPVAAGCVTGLFTFIRSRLQLHKAFRQGRAESLVREPMPIEPMPTFEVVA